MIAVRKLLFAIIFLSLVSAGCAFGSAANVYITPNGSPTGNCSSNVQTPAFVTTSGNWGSGSTQIGPGTTVLFCGTFNLAAGASGLTVQGNGTSTNGITIAFDTGAILQSPAFAGFGSSYGAGIVINGFSYITVDGKNTGTIQNTLNGSPGQTCLSGACSVKQSSLGFYIHKTTGVEVKNLTVRNIYMDKNAEQSNAAFYSGDLYTDGPNSSLTIDGNTLKDAHVGAWISFDNGSTTANVFNNTIAHHAWQISAANGSSSSSSANINIYSNTISDYSDWNAGGDGSFHTDGIIDFTASGAPMFNPQIYDNYFYGDLDGGTGSGTAHIDCGTTNKSSSCTVFNNVVDMSGSTHCAAAIWIEGVQGQIYNNTLIGPSKCLTGASYGVVFQGTENTLVNNIISSVTYFYGDPGPYGNVATEIAASDHNIFYNCLGGNSCWAFGQGNWSTLAAWSAAQGKDKNSSPANPLLTASYTLGTGSPAIGLGDDMDSALGLDPCCKSLTPVQANIGVNALAYDKTLVARTTSGSWNSGAYEGAGSALAPPTGLVATVH